MGIKRKRKNTYRKRRTRIKQQILRFVRLTSLAAAVTAMSICFIFGYDFITQHSYFAAKNISVSGTRILSDPQVLEQAGIRSKSNIFSINLSVARKKLLAHPWIKEAAISRKLPGTIHISIAEHRPLAIIDLDRRFLINSEGDIFKEWSPPDPADLPLISGLEFSDLKSPGEAASVSFQAVMSVLQLGKENGNILANRLIKKIQVDREIGLTLLAFDKTKAIKLGYHDYADKYKILESVLSQLERRHEFGDFESIDLNNPNRIVVLPVKPAVLIGHKKEV